MKQSTDTSDRQQPAVCRRTLLAATIGTIMVISLPAGAQVDGAAQRDFCDHRDTVLQAQDATSIPGSLLLRFVDGVGQGQTDAVLAAAGATRIRGFGLVPGLTHIQVPAVAQQRVINALQRSPLVAYVEVDQVVSRNELVVPDDQFFNLQWGLGLCDHASALSQR